jgi:hypothetical protein
MVQNWLFLGSFAFEDSLIQISSIQIPICKSQ